MKDYSAMSDFEINSAVHNALLSDPYSMLFMGNDRIEWTSKDGRKVITDKVQYTKNGVHDYCNNPADAWPIIVSNQISLMYEEATGKWCAGKPYWVDGCEWQLDIDVMEANPLRAAMIVFLMMKEGE